MAIEAPVWFDEKFYLNAKADQLNAIKYNGKSDWTGDAVKASLGEMSAYDHYMAFGAVENISPSPMFNVAEYLKAKADQLNADKYDGKTDWTEAKVLESFKAAGMSAWDHYVKFGMSEGLNPSNMFDNDAYLAAKADALNAAKHEGKTDWTADDVAAAFKAAGMTPVQHYYEFGKTEGLKAPQVDPADRVISSYDPYKPVNPGKTYDLTTAKDTIDGTANDDVINGVSSSLTAERTLNAEDVIDGKGGNDTLNVDMKGSFSGFTTGSMTNVENVVLNADGSVPLSFNAKNMTGVESWTLNSKNAAISLSELDAAGIAVNVVGLKEGTTNIGFTTEAVKGDSDALTLGLNNVGAAQTDKSAAKYVNVKAGGIEDLTVKVTGDNHVNLDGAADDSVIVKGAGNLDVSKVTSTVTSFDASLLSGNVKADLTGTTLEVLKGGAGDDTFTVDDLAGTAVLDGGAGNDTLVLKGLTGTLQPTMKGFENITADGGTLTISGKNASDFTGLTVKNNAAVELANINASAFTVTSVASNGTVTLSDATAVTYNTQATDAALKSKTDVAVGTNISADKATSATVNVGAYTTVTGTLGFANAKGELAINVASGLGTDGKTEQTTFGGATTIVNANNVSSLNIKADGNLAAATYNVGKAESVVVNAANGGAAQNIQAGAAFSVSITAGKDMALTGSSFAKAQTVTLVQNDGALTGIAALDALHQLTVSGAGKDSQVTLGTLGDTSLDYDITVNASGLKKGFSATSITAGSGAALHNVTLNLDDMAGAFALSGGIAGQNVTINAATQGTTSVGGAITASGNVTVDAMGVTGGNATTVAVSTAAITADKDVSILFDGSSDMTFGAIAGENVTINASGYLGAITNSHTGVVDATFGTITGDTVAITGSEIKANTFSGASAITADTLNFTGGLGVDTVAVTSSSGATDMNVTLNTGAGVDDVTVTGGAAAKNITVKGDLGGNGDTIVVTGALATGVKIDLNALNGYGTSTLTGTAGKDTIIGGAGNDTIKTGTPTSISINDSLTGGAGNDIFEIGLIGSPSTTAGITATITDFNKLGDDSIKGFGAGSVTGAYLELTDKTKTTLADLWTAVTSDASLATTNKIIVGELANGETYAFHVTITGSSGSWVANTDAVVALGTMGTDGITAADFIA